MLSLSEQLHNFLAEWEANQQMAGKAAVTEGQCDHCGRSRYVLYDIAVDASFCSSQCNKRYRHIVTMGKTYAG